MVNVSGEPQTGTPPAGEIQFSIGSNQDDFVRAPKFVANDPATKAPTTYIPVYYADLFLQQRLLMGVSWNKTTWSMTTQNEPLKITVSSAPMKAKVGQSITISGVALLKNGVGAPDTELGVMGLDQPEETSNGRVAMTDTNGHFSYTTTIPTAGTYTVTFVDYNVSSQPVKIIVQ
ncbi:hypothetical protein [Alicyclobacillus acidiphilus]|uniref:hypothetical protein n=1 Tax=Alicyclobacillus acidiphilus TaxID=182455 RepID=UPI00082EE017|nr:hypothetical protein [Alicyclobacillus acidiphilus]